MNVVSNRILIQCELKPLQGRRFQPTGFPDLGAGEFRLPDDTSSLLVDSPQAVTNHMEQHCLTSDKKQFVDVLNGLSIVHVKDKNGNYLTNSVREAHRVASPYVLGEGKKKTEIGSKFDKLDEKKKALASRSEIINTIFRYDINSLLHGVWLSRTGEGRIKIPRAVSAFVEADKVREVVSGGVKRDHVTTSTKSKEDNGNVDDESKGGDASSGIGSIPFARVEYTAETITAYFNIDLEQIQSYGLGEEKTKLLTALALWKIKKFIESPFRPRTACDLAIVRESMQTSPKEFEMPDISTLESIISTSIDNCRDSMETISVTYPQS